MNYTLPVQPENIRGEESKGSWSVQAKQYIRSHIWVLAVVLGPKYYLHLKKYIGGLFSHTAVQCLPSNFKLDRIP